MRVYTFQAMGYTAHLITAPRQPAVRFPDEYPEHEYRILDRRDAARVLADWRKRYRIQECWDSCLLDYRDEQPEPPRATRPQEERP